MFATVLVVGCVGLGFANAGGSATAVISAEANLDSTEAQTQTSFSATSSAAASSERFILETSATRDVSAGVAEIAAEEEAARKLAEERARTGELQAIERGQAAQSAANANGGVDTSCVDFNVGRKAFIEEWSARINDYLEGTNLAGYGTTFATAAWESGIDPRWSPAISNTESGNASDCFAPCNAWGWTDGAWGSWEEAIYAHAAGLAEVYGFTLSHYNAEKYCPPFSDYWYSNTLNEMQKI